MINKDRLRERLLELAQIGGNATDGWTRLAFTKEDKLARGLVKGYMREMGLKITCDNAGNIIGSYGNPTNSPVIAMGSHIDTVPNGGMFDGALGVISALEVAQTIIENKLNVNYPLEVIIFANEEGSRFNNGLTGSRAICGSFSQEELQIEDNNGISFYQAVQEMDLNPDKVYEARAFENKYKHFLEIHIEQGIELEKEHKRIGLVNSAAGQVVLKCTIFGRPDHAGAIKMTQRKDALVEASKLITEIQQISLKMGGHFVATVGKLNVFPNSINTVPGNVEFFIDIRDISSDKLNRGIEVISNTISNISGEFSYFLEEVENELPAFFSSRLLDLGKEICEKKNYPYKVLSSGACHDAQVMTTITDSALFFIPSINGLSHCPEENVHWEDVFLGAEFLLEMVLNASE
ncbi:M20 family metallo-hydrolase [Domibacillus indicus]|uniref:M20 family metallo-hydrolase n=1 Tax=Domibacillus indicus TaxID=1437523 RepID=UPI002041F092|nr:M20 family metallo-hydrolase [Domibacillus indicus]MCM3790028.1 M20 family metallo-hydrolase [Domibacillus indicus]